MNFLLKIKNFLKEAKVELRKVVWPSREEVVRYTGIVVAASLVVALFLGIIDYILYMGIEKFF